MGPATIGALWAGLGVGAAAGAHTSTWGMFKDAPHEGFTWRKYARSITLGSMLGPAAATLAGLDPTHSGGAVVLFGLVYALERALVEFYKTFVREEDQSKYTIPMQFAVLGKVVEGRARRWTVAGAVALVASLLALGAASLHTASLPLPVLLLVGSAAGWVSAFGGAWKDAPVEGFETLKFFRSPVITGTYAFLISRLDGRMLIVALCALGYTVATIETYKTFFFPNKPRGKWADKPIAYPEWLRLRLGFVPLYVGVWVFVIAAFAQALHPVPLLQDGALGRGRRRAAGATIRVGREVHPQPTAAPSPWERAPRVV